MAKKGFWAKPLWPQLYDSWFFETFPKVLSKMITHSKAWKSLKDGVYKNFQSILFYHFPIFIAQTQRKPKLSIRLRGSICLKSPTSSPTVPSFIIAEEKVSFVPWATILRLLCVWQSPKICLQLLGNPDLRWEKNPKLLPKTSFAAWAIISSVPCPIRAKHQPSEPACFRPENCYCPTPPWYYSESKTPAPSFLPQLLRGYSASASSQAYMNFSRTAFLTAASKSRPRHVRKLSWRDALNYYYSSTQTQASERTLRRNLAAPAVSSHRCNSSAKFSYQK